MHSSAWSKQPSHAKHTQQSDIILGDVRRFNNYQSTNNAQYTTTTTEQHATQPSTTTTTQVSTTQKSTTNNIQPHKISNIVFGDSKSNHFKTTSNITYTNIHPPDQDHNHPLKTIWNSKNELLMASDHVGTSTKHDLPTDYKTFKSFDTTTSLICSCFTRFTYTEI